MTPVSFLLVDDLEENLLSLEALLRRDGLVLLKARSGDEALELLLKHDVALALVDVQMPGLSGFDLAELMRGNDRTRHVPIIFVTAGNADSQRRFRGYEAGAVDFIHKPIEPDIIRSKADVFFELHRQRQQIAAQRDELKARSAALEEADRRKDEFLATLAHELRNPLAPLRHGIDVLRRKPDGDSAEDIRAMMDRQLTQMVRLIDDLLDVSRISQGKIELRRERLQAAEIVRLALEASRPLIESHGHRLTVDVPDAAIWLDADLTRMAQVLGNLLNNAAKYTPEGGRSVWRCASRTARW
jgi:signal transduction histidine kinase